MTSDSNFDRLKVALLCSLPETVAMDAISRIESYESELKELREKLGVAVKCIEFYADRDSWNFNSYSSDCKEVITFSDLGCKSYNEENDFKDYACSSGGRRAREALEKLRGK